MILWDRIRKSLDDGLEVVTQVAAALSERVRIESAVARLMFDKGGMERKVDRLYRRLGDRVFHLWRQGEGGLMDDAEVRDALRDIDRLKDELDSIRGDISNISTGEEEE